MSNELLDRVRLIDPANAMDPSELGLWGSDEVLRDVERRLASAPPAMRRWRPALAVAASFLAVIALVGALAWLARSDTDVEPTDQPVVTTTVPSTSMPPTTLGANPDVAADVRNLAWVGPSLDEAVFGPSSRLMAVAASDSLVVLGGSDSGSAAIWISTDRFTWTRVPHDEDVFGGPGEQEIKAIAAWGSGFVAAGEVGGVDDFDPERNSVIWYSEDGFNWNRVPHDESLFGGQGRQEVFSMAASGDHLMIVGFDEAGPATGSGEGMVTWTSTDGVTWTKRLDAVSAEVLGVAPTTEGFVAVGHAADSSSLWGVSPDGDVWELIAGVDQLRPGVPIDVAVSGSTIVVVGITLDGSEQPAIWTRAGIEWTRMDLGSVTPDVPVIGSVAAADSGVVAVGRGGDTGGSSAVLVSIDGLEWRVVDALDALSTSNLESVVAFQGHFVVVGNGLDGEPQVWTTEQ